MSKLTISIKPELVREVRVEAAKRGFSNVTDWLHDHLRHYLGLEIEDADEAPAPKK